jgi:hypothetical protein
MAKTIFSKPIGGDGAQVTVGTDDSGNLVLGVTYPIAKLEGPVDKAIDDLSAKVESALGAPAWLKAIVDPLDAAAKAEIGSLIGG